MGLLDGKVAIVTGTGRMRGLGRAIAMRLGEEGADVCVTSIGRDPVSFPEAEREAGWRGIESVAEEVRQGGRRALAVDADVSRPADVSKLFSETLKELGRVDILVNNAGLSLVAGGKNLWEMDDQEWQDEIDVNLNGVYYCSKEAAKALIEQGTGGKIVNISSLAGVKAQPQYGGYTPAKFAVIGLTQMLALELAPYNVTVNAVCPGSSSTDMMDGTFTRMAERAGVPAEKVKEGMKRFIPLGRQADQREIADMVWFLSSPASDYVTGQVVSVDGGAGLR